jgi:hypothetical protein
MHAWLWILLPLAAPAPSDVIEVGRETWERPWMPDLRQPGRQVPIPVEKRIDVAILGDGYLAGERAQFEKDVKAWHDRFLQYTPWSRLRGAFRVRGLWTPGEGRATPEKRSHYRLPATPADVGDVEGEETRAAVFDALDRLGVNPARQGRDLTHAVVVLLVLDERGRNPSGKCRGLASPDGRTRVRVAFAAYTHHEFGHAWGGLRDEYILKAGTRSDRTPPERLSVFTVSNLAHATDRRRLPWAHLAPGGALNPDPASVIGVCWLGGVEEEGVWHSEGRCLMNGRHENWDLGKTRRGEALRDNDRFCFWCEEIVVARTFARTGLLGEGEDGEALWTRWEELRPSYQKAFDVAARIRAQNAADAKAKLGEARIFVRPTGP